MGLNNLQRLICYETQLTNQQTNHLFGYTPQVRWVFAKDFRVSLKIKKRAV